MPPGRRGVKQSGTAEDSLPSLRVETEGFFIRYSMERLVAEMEKVYNPKEIERKWQKIWEDEKAFAAVNDYSRPKYYALVEFPYPSGQASTWDIPVRIRRWISLPEREGWRATMCCTPWDGTRSAFPRRIMRSRIISIRRS